LSIAPLPDRKTTEQTKIDKVEAKKPIIDPVAAQKRVFSNVN
jgi:hypothetical protein